MYVCYVNVVQTDNSSRWMKTNLAVVPFFKDRKKSVCVCFFCYGHQIPPHLTGFPFCSFLIGVCTYIHDKFSIEMDYAGKNFGPAKV